MALLCAIRRATSIAVPPLTNRGRVPAISKRFYSAKEVTLSELLREALPELQEKYRDCSPRRRRSYEQYKRERDYKKKFRFRTPIITDDYLLEGLPPGTKFDLEGIRKVLYKIQHPFEDMYLQLPRWAINADDSGDDDQDDFDRLLDDAVAGLWGDEEPHTHHQS